MPLFSDPAVDAAAARAAVEIALHVGVGATVVVAAAALSAYALRGRSAATRYAVWRAAVVVLLVMPLCAPLVPALGPSLGSGLGLWTPGGSAEGPVGTAVTSFEPAASGQASPAFDAEAAPRRVDTPEPSGASSARWSRRAAAAIAAVWGAGAAVLLLRLALGAAQVALVTARARPYAAGERAAARLAEGLGIRRRVRVRRTEGVAAPLTWGALRPVVVLPSEAAGWSSDRLRAVLLHELAHVRRLDYPAHLAVRIAVAAYWPNPAVWLAARRMGLEREQACDDDVLRAGTRAHDYAAHLLAVARGARAHDLRAAIAMASGPTLKRRIRALLDPAADRGRAAPRAVIVAGLTLAAVAVVVLAVRPADPPAADGPLDPVVAAALAPSPAEPDVPAAPPAAPPAVAPDEPAAAFTYLRIEAEDGRRVGAMTAAGDDAASGGRFVWVPPGPGREAPDGSPDSVSFRFRVPKSGAYTVWGRIRAEAADDNSFFVAVDGGREVIWDVPGPDGWDTAAFNRLAPEWTWDAVSARDPATRRTDDPFFVRLEAGMHTLRIRNREDGARLDALVVTDDPSFRPRGRTGEAPAASAARPVFVWREAEDALLTAPLRVLEDATASGGAYLEAPADRDSRARPPADGRARFPFTIDERGTFVVWGLVSIADRDEDSFWVRIDDGPWIAWNGIPRRRAWHWAPVRPYDAEAPAAFALGAGRHTLEIAYREGDTELDRLLVTNDLGYVPSGAGARGEAVDADSRVRVIFR